YIGKKTLVVGSGHSAVNTWINLSELKRKNPNTTIVWVLRKKEVSETFSTPKDKILGRYKLEENIEQLVSKGYIEVHTPFYINEARQKKNKVNVLKNISKLKRKNPNTTIVWVLRKKEVSETFSTPKDKILSRYKLEENIEQLVSNGYIELHTPFYINEIRQKYNKVNVLGKLGKEEQI